MAAIAGGVLAIDNRSSLGLMVSQPLCAGAIIGMMLGSPTEGMLAGGLVQMVFLGRVPVRGERVPDLPVAGVAAAGLYILVNRRVGGDPALGGIILFWSLLAAILVSALGDLFYRRWERLVATLVEPAVRSAREGSSVRLSVIHCAMLLIHFAYAFCTLLAVLAAGMPLLSRGAVMLAGLTGETFGSLAALVPFIGVGALLRLHFVRTRVFWFGAGFLVSYVFVLTRG